MIIFRYNKIQMENQYVVGRDGNSIKKIESNILEESKGKEPQIRKLGNVMRKFSWQLRLKGVMYKTI